MVKKREKTKKVPKLKTVKKKAWKIYSEYIRLRDCLRTTGLPDYGRCISCNKIVPRTLLQAGHFIPGKHNANLFYEKGTHAQCYNCNINLCGNILNYMDALIKLYGQGIIEELRMNDKKSVKFILADLQEKAIEYKKRIKEMKDMYK